MHCHKDILNCRPKFSDEATVWGAMVECWSPFARGADCPLEAQFAKPLLARYTWLCDLPAADRAVIADRCRACIRDRNESTGLNARFRDLAMDARRVATEKP